MRRDEDKALNHGTVTEEQAAANQAAATKLQLNQKMVKPGAVDQAKKLRRSC